MVQNKSFQELVGRLLRFGQFFALLPVINNSSSDESQLKFKWKSFRTIYSLIFLIFGSIEIFLETRRILVIGFSIAYAEDLLFYITSMVRAFLLFRLALKWKIIIKY